MSSTSQKHRNFVVEPMGEKPVTDLAGIGEVLGDRLTHAGFDKVGAPICRFFGFSSVPGFTLELFNFIWFGEMYNF